MLRTRSCATPSRRRRSGPRHRSGFTLLEVMIATAITLLMMISLAQIFKVIGDSMRQGRAALELNSRLRSVAHRIRLDLENLTVIPDPPADPSHGLGYLKYHDGSLTDYSAALYSSSLATDLSRFGDVDDILMGTARAGDVWFTGKVPRFVLLGAAPNVSADSDGNGVPDDLEMVTIAAQHAEIVMFVQPVVTTVGNPSRDPNYFITTNELSFEDRDNLDGSGNGFPDAFNLHYRALLIRPDLNLDTGLLPARPDGGNSWLIAQPQGPLPSPLCDMAAAHEQCDLSLRRAFNPNDGLPATADRVAANSLEDLMDPANRFAHVQVPLPGTPSTTMPLLALGQTLPLLNTADPSGAVGVGSGFLHPAYTLRNTQVDDVTLARVGEDILASNILAFDVKAFDPGVPLLLGGTDGPVLSPNDPGYREYIGTAPVAMGEYVDVGWARKMAAHFVYPSPITASIASNLWTPLSGFSEETFRNGRAPEPRRPIDPFTEAIFKSGQVISPRGGGQPLVLQLGYDTWTNKYEGDGLLQAERGTSLRGNVRINGTVALYGATGNDLSNAQPPWRQSNIDAGTDGIDNDPPAPPPIGNSGVDDMGELETSPPFPVKLRGLKIAIRMEDPATRQVRQMSVAKEFVTQ